MCKFLGLDIGGTKTAVCVGNEKGVILAQKKFLTHSDPYKTLDQAIKIATQLSKDLKIENFKSCGISCGGPLDSKNGIILCPPHLQKWKNIKICEYISQRLKTPTYIENDANACALAELLWGNGKGCKNMVFLTFGTGFGAGLILNGNLYRGTNSQAGEIGHIKIKETGPYCYGKKGAIEGFCSGAGISALYKTQTGKNLNANEIFDLANNDDISAKNVIKESAKMLGLTLSMIIDLLNVEKIIIGSIYTRRESIYKPIIEEIIREETLELNYQACEISPSGLGDNLGNMASLGVAMWGDKNGLC